MTDAEPVQQESTPLLAHLTKAADMLGLSPYQTKILVKNGELPTVKVGTRTYIPVTAIREYVEALGRAS
jgi:excisionase family DNA binding protein